MICINVSQAQAEVQQGISVQIMQYDLIFNSSKYLLTYLVRRGCESICPTGSSAPVSVMAQFSARCRNIALNWSWKTVASLILNMLNPFLMFCSSVMSDVPRLTSVISQMGERIRALERAVANTDSGLGGSSDPHPLLSRAPTPTRPSTPIIKSEPLGSLSVNEAGDALYFGPTAGTEVYISRTAKIFLTLYVGPLLRAKLI